ncbi:MAG: hypothetical protein ACLFNK_05465 [Candidatus Woesearchaeota archaeon]
MSPKWLEDNPMDLEFKETRLDEYGNFLDFYTIKIDPLRHLSPEKEWGEGSGYEILSRAVLGLRRKFEEYFRIPGYSPFASHLENLFSVPRMKRMRKEAQKDLQDLDDILNFLEENSNMIEEDDSLWSATEDWILSYLEKTSESDALQPSVYARKSLEYYKSKVYD